MNRVEDLINSAKTNELLGELLHIKKEEEKKSNILMWVGITIAAVLAVAGIAYAVYRFFTPDYLEDFDEDFDDDFDDDYFDDEDDFEDEKPRRGGLFGRKSSRYDDEDEDDYDDEPAPRNSRSSRRQPEEKPAPVAVSSSNKVTPMRSPSRRAGGNMEVCVIKPTSMEDAREITETLLSNRTVVLNMEGLDMDIAQRIIDFASGSCFAINGNLQKIANYIFIITPATVDISGDFQNLLSGALGGMPSITSNF